MKKFASVLVGAVGILTIALVVVEFMAELYQGDREYKEMMNSPENVGY